MANRVRPISTVNEPSDEERAQAETTISECIADLDEASNSVIVRLSRIANPVERAKAAAAIRAYTSGTLTRATDTLFRDAVLEAYGQGRADYGWHGYGALALELGISRAKVQQVINGSYGGKPKDPEVSHSIRETADALRQARNLARKGKTITEIADATGLSEPAVRDALSE